jgi:alkylation response protein AidB-like acyl-CoA dehydrogenase
MPQPFSMLDRPLAGGENAWREDPVLRHLLRRTMSDACWRWAEPQLDAMGALAPRIDALGALADRHGPTLMTHDRTGARIDEIRYHPAYLELARIAYGSGMIAAKYDPPTRVAHPEGLHGFGFGMGYLFAQGEAGLYCPACMTDGAARVVERYGNDALLSYYVPRLASRELETLMTGAMFLTEKQGGSDVGANATRAVHEGRSEFGDVWRLHGEKWFCSNVDAGVALVLARPEGAEPGTRGLGLFLVPRPLPDGRRNEGVIIERIKDKLGTRSMPTGEVRLDGAIGFAVGDVRRGFRMMLDMVSLSRLYNAVASASCIRRATSEAIRWSKARNAFGRPIVEHPLCASTLADLSAESVAATALVFAAVHALDRSDARGLESEVRWMRILTPLAKGYLGKLAVAAASEAMEVVGGNGYVEEWVFPRLLRDAQVLPIWEGTTHIQVLDAFRAMAKDGAHAALFEHTRGALGGAIERGLSGAADAVSALDDLERALPVLAEKGERGQHHWRAWFDRAAQATEIALCLREAAAPAIPGSPSGDDVREVFAAAGEHLARKHLRGARPVLADLGTHAADLRLLA